MLGYVIAFGPLAALIGAALLLALELAVEDLNGESKTPAAGSAHTGVTTTTGMGPRNGLEGL